MIKITQNESEIELSRVSLESEEGIHTIQDLECEETIDTCLTQDIFSKIQYKTTAQVVHPRLLSDFQISEESDLDQLKCSEVYPCHLNSNLTIYSDISSYQEPSDISEGELGLNKENLPKFMSAMGTENFNQRNINFAPRSYASPIAKTKLLKNAFLTESEDKATTCSQIQSSRHSKGNTPHTLCVKSARPHFQKKVSIKQRRDSILKTKGSQRRSSNFSQKTKPSGVHVVERGKVLFADTYKKKPKGIQTPTIKSMSSKPSPVKFPNTQGSFYLSKNRSNASNLISQQKPSAYRNLFGGGPSSSSRSKKQFLKKVQEEQHNLPFRLLKLQTRQKEFFGSRPDTQRQFKEEAPKITEIDANCQITIRVSTASNMSTNNSINSRLSNINRPTAQFGDQSRLMTEEHSGPFQPAIEPEMLIPIHKRRGGGLSKPRAAICNKKKSQIQSTGNSPFKYFQQSPLQDLSNGYRYSFSFQKYKKNQSRVI